jgi:hypothetical protein
MPGAQCTRSLVCAGGSKYAHQYSQRRHRKHPAFPTQWFYGLYRALPGDEFLFATVVGELTIDLRPVGPIDLRQLDISNGCQDHTTSPYAHAPFVLRAGHRSRRAIRPAIPLHARRCRVHRIPPRVRDDRDTPLSVGRDGVAIAAIRISENQNIFCYGTRQPKSHQI